MASFTEVWPVWAMMGTSPASAQAISWPRRRSSLVRHYEEPLDVQRVDVVANVGPEGVLVDVVVLIDGIGNRRPDALHVLLAVGTRA
jgi:hypothetical protein